MKAMPPLSEVRYSSVSLSTAIGGRVPHITVRAFSETSVTADTIESTLDDRRFVRADTMHSTGGIAAATAYCKASPSPDLLILESVANPPVLLAQLAELASYCDAGTKVIVIGISNDVALFRDLLETGVTDYLLAPTKVSDLSTTILRLFRAEGATKPGKIFAFVGAKGGVGSSTVAQNMAAILADSGSGAVLLADLDLQFGSVALNLNFEIGNNLFEQMGDVSRLDDALLERLLVSRGKHLQVLAATSASLGLTSPSLDLLDKLIDLTQASYPYIVLDLPHVWSPWVHRVVVASDQVIVTAMPDLGCLHNTKALLDHLADLRPNDPAPHLVLNQVGVPKKAEIKPEAFAKALQATDITEIGFDPSTFSNASNVGQLVVEHNPKVAASRKFRDLATSLVPNSGLVRKRTGLARLWSR